MLTVNEAAARRGISAARVRKLIQGGRLPASTIVNTLGHKEYRLASEDVDGLELRSPGRKRTDGVRLWPIRFRPLMLEKAKQGEKTETRRTNSSWLKARKGDLLRVLKDGQILEVTADTVKEPLQSITDAEARAEGFEDVKAFAAYWDELQAGETGASWADNPDVIVIRFRVYGQGK